MALQFGTSIDMLPLIPEATLKKHHCHEPLDNRFRAAARLLQSIWREDRGLPMGSYVSEGGRSRKLGSRISNGAGKAGCNFLTEEIAHLAWRDIAYREMGATIDEDRLYTNLLCSMSLCFNIFAPLKQDLVQATSALHELVPGFEGRVTQVLFEHSPGRGHAQFTADYTAFDVLMRYVTPARTRGFVAFEVKYSESMREPVARIRPRYDELSNSCGLFRDPADPILRDNPYGQLWRESMLAQSMIDAGQYDEGYFVLLGPKHNHFVQEAAEGYLSFLNEPTDGKAVFCNLTLEAVVEALRLCDPDHAQALYRRYCDWWLVDGEIELNAPKFGLRKKSECSIAPEQEKPKAAANENAKAVKRAPRNGEAPF